MKLLFFLFFCFNLYGNLDIIWNQIIKYEGKKVFEKFYYDKYRLNSISNFNIKLITIDTIYNLGVVGIKLIQKSINEISDQNICIDGIFGTQTIKALNSVDEHLYIEKLKILRIEYYKTRNHFKKYGNGWLRRINEITSLD